MNYTPKELELCRWLHDHGIGPEIREGDWFFNVADKKGEKIFCSHRLIWITEPVREFFVLIFTWERARAWLRERGWRLVSGFEGLSEQIELRFEYTKSMIFCDGSGATDLEAILSVMRQVAEGEKR